MTNEPYMPRNLFSIRPVSSNVAVALTARWNLLMSESAWLTLAKPLKLNGRYRLCLVSYELTSAVSFT
ncbi:hypothetical protein H9L39_05636 [Fusarium oxysporum f. sp. albedinis]|nr:hypothetical protein H9L39_05636 [Fusarium oxysporum f. sp. albedinis]